jgi:hypothetical protein
MEVGKMVVLGLFIIVTAITITLTITHAQVEGQEEIETRGVYNSTLEELGARGSTASTELKRLLEKMTDVLATCDEAVTSFTEGRSTTLF